MKRYDDTRRIRMMSSPLVGGLIRGGMQKMWM